MLLSLVLIAGVIGFVLWNNSNKPVIIKKEYAGIRWTDRDPEHDDSFPITLAIDGVATKDEAFRGTIVISSGDEELYRFENCKLVHEYFYYLCDADFPERYTPERLPALEHYAVVFFSEDWSDVVLVNVKEKVGRWDSTSAVVFSAPATTEAEAIETARRATAGMYSSFS